MMQSRESICLAVIVAGSVSKVESDEEQSPSGLTWIQTFSISQVLQVFMVGDDLKMMVFSL